ncbi:transporter substrate-binding domain-containing protein [Variovorax paradoxus]|jgi:polar amino acid transport system substrate-binding protein|uniref:transporter substrate-binding domain-containing protein n=1 Tax=Variovorax paradoxus TaxID=34073 RepID=UPI0033915D1F
MTSSLSFKRRGALLSALVLALPLAFASASAHADQLDTITAAKKIRVAIDLAVPPYGLKDEKLNATGSDVETARLLARSLGLELEIVPTTGANRIPFLQTDKADIVISSMSVTPEREKVVDFSVPYAAILAVVGAPKSMTITGPADLAGKKVIATRGTTNDQEVTKILPAGAQVVRFDDDATSITAVVSGQADIFATAPPLLKTINEKNPAKQMEPKFTMKVNMLAIGMRKNEPRLKAKLDEFVKAQLKSGDLNTIYKKFHGADLPADVMRNGA